MTLPRTRNSRPPLSSAQTAVLRTLQQHPNTVAVFNVHRRGIWLETPGIGEWTPEHPMARTSLRRLALLGLLHETSTERGVARYGLTTKGVTYETGKLRVE